MIRTARMSQCGKYRYSLTREWDDEKPQITFMMLNPSTADSSKDDNTIRRCIEFARSWGYGSLAVVNLYSYITPKPEILAKEKEPHGPDHWDSLVRVLDESEALVLAWGAPGINFDKTYLAQRIRSAKIKCYCLGTTRNGEPKHPLYLSSTTNLLPYRIK